LLSGTTSGRCMFLLALSPPANRSVLQTPVLILLCRAIAPQPDTLQAASKALFVSGHEYGGICVHSYTWLRFDQCCYTASGRAGVAHAAGLTFTAHANLPESSAVCCNSDGPGTGMLRGTTRSRSASPGASRSCHLRRDESILLQVVPGHVNRGLQDDLAPSQLTICGQISAGAWLPPSMDMCPPGTR